MIELKPLVSKALAAVLWKGHVTVKNDKNERKRGFKQKPMGIITNRVVEKGFSIVKSIYVEPFVTKQNYLQENGR